MADRWFGLCAPAERNKVRQTIAGHDGDATVLFVETAHELRRSVQEAQGTVGAFVGPVEVGISAVNVVAALARDGMAREVVLVVADDNPELRERAKRAGASAVLVMSAGQTRVQDLDEPDSNADAVPTMLMLPQSSAQGIEMRVPQVEGQKPPTITAARNMRHPKASLVSDANMRGGAPKPPELPEGTLVLASDPARGPKAKVVPVVPAPSRERLKVVENSAESSLPWEHRDEGSSHRAPVLTFVGGRGGVGKTAVTATMASAAARWGMRVAVLDLDLGWGNLYDAFGLPGPADLSVLAQSEHPSADDVLDVSRHARDGIELWGGCELPEMAETVMPLIDVVLDALRTSFDLVLVDTSTTLTDAVAQAVQECDRLVIVVDGRPGSSAAQRRLGALAVRLGVARTRMVRIANRCGPRGRNETQINRADLGLETARGLRVYEGGTDVSECLAEGKPEDLFELGSRFWESAAASLATMLEELGCLPQHPEAHQALESRQERSKWSFGHRKGVM